MKYLLRLIVIYIKKSNIIKHNMYNIVHSSVMGTPDP